MKSVVILFLLSLFAANGAPKYSVTRYVRPAGPGFTLESEILWKKTATGVRYLSVTHRRGVKMRLLINFHKQMKISSATIVQETSKGKNSIQAQIRNRQASIFQGGKVVKKLKFKSEPVLVTTAPDWSDIMLLLRRYDRKKAGRQEFAGLWFHPSQKARVLTFSVEKIGDDVIERKGKKTKLGKHRVTLRSGAYFVWADNAGVVYKLMHAKQRSGGVILQGYERATRGLVGGQ